VRLSRKIPTTQMFVIAGLDKEGRYVCVRAYYYKSKKHKQHSYRVWIDETGDHKKLGPEAAFVLSTARE